MRYPVLAGLAAGALMLGACSTTSPTTNTVVTDAESALTDGQAVLSGLVADGKISTAKAAIANEVIDGLEALLQAESSATASSTESQAITVAQAAVAQVEADLPSNTTVQTAGGVASSALAALAATDTASARTQAAAATAAVLLDYLAAQGGTQAAAARLSVVR